MTRPERTRLGAAALLLAAVLALAGVLSGVAHTHSGPQDDFSCQACRVVETLSTGEVAVEVALVRPAPESAGAPPAPASVAFAPALRALSARAPPVAFS